MSVKLEQVNSTDSSDDPQLGLEAGCLQQLQRYLFAWSPIELRVVSLPNHLLNLTGTDTLYGRPTPKLGVYFLFLRRLKPWQCFFCFLGLSIRITLVTLLKDLVVTLVSPLVSQNALS